MQSDNDSVFTDADEDPAPQRAEGKKRQRSMREMLQGFEDRSQKKGRRTSPLQSGGGLSEEALRQISGLIASGNAQLTEHLDRKWEAVERRCEVLEHALFEERTKSEALAARVSAVEHDNQRLRDQLESLDVNRRLDNLILRCQDFGTREPGEDIEAKIVDVLTRKLPGLSMATSDIRAAHRLQSDSTVICKFMKRQLRDDIYENRFQQRAGDPAKRLFITESLSAQNKEIMNVLVQAKKRRQIYTVFSRRGLVYVKCDRDSGSRRIDNMSSLERLLSEVGGRGAVPGAAPGAGGAGSLAPRAGPVPGGGGRPGPPGGSGRAGPVSGAGRAGPVGGAMTWVSGPSSRMKSTR